MSKKQAFELIYSRQATDFLPGRAYSNPRFFIGPRSGVDRVYIVGDWPQIRAAYEALGVPVEQLDETGAVRPAAKADPGAVEPPPALTPVASADERSDIEIPADWRDMPWTGKGHSLRALAAKFSDAPVINKDQAVAAVEAELARREAAAPPVDAETDAE